MESKLSVFDEVLAELAYAISDNDRLTGAQIDAQMSELRNRYNAASSKELEPNKCVYCHNVPMQADLLYTDVDVKTIVYVENEMLHLESASMLRLISGFAQLVGGTYMPKQTEGQFQAQVINYLKEQGVWYVKYWAGGRFTKEGVPDIIALIDGTLHGIELKSDGTSYNETKLQAFNLDSINYDGGQGYVLRPTTKPKVKHPEFNYYCMTFDEWKRRWFE